MYRLLENYVYLWDYKTKSLKTLQLNAAQHAKIKQNQLSFNNPEDIHDIAIIYNNLYMTLRHCLSHLHIKLI